MKTKILFIALFLIIAQSAIAGDIFEVRKGDERHFCFKGGANFTSTGVVATDLQDISVKNYIGWHAGAAIRFNLPEGFSLQPEVLWRQSGSKLVDNTNGNEYSLETGSVFIPIELEWGPRISIFRPFVSGHIGGQFPVQGKIDGYDERSSFNDATFCYGFGVGIEIWRFVFTWRYNWTTAQFKDKAVEMMPALESAGLCGYDFSLTIMLGGNR